MGTTVVPHLRGNTANAAFRALSLIIPSGGKQRAPAPAFFTKHSVGFVLTPTLSIQASTTCYEDRGQDPERGWERAYLGEACVMGVLHPLCWLQAGLRRCVLLGNTVGPQWVAVGRGQVSELLILSVWGGGGPGSRPGECRGNHQAVPST